LGAQIWAAQTFGSISAGTHCQNWTYFCQNFHDTILTGQNLSKPYFDRSEYILTGPTCQSHVLTGLDLSKHAKSCQNMVLTELAQTDVDSHGLHIISGCNKDACRTSLHDAVKRELNTMLKSGGQLSIVEQRNAFHIIDPDDHRRPTSYPKTNRSPTQTYQSPAPSPSPKLTPSPD
jgi:hypothetical protein